MIVDVGGKQYEISGIAYGTVPAWKLIKIGGAPMTHQQFNNLSEAEKHALAAHVQAHLRGMQGR